MEVSNRLLGTDLFFLSLTSKLQKSPTIMHETHLHFNSIVLPVFFLEANEQNGNRYWDVRKDTRWCNVSYFPALQGLKKYSFQLCFAHSANLLTCRQARWSSAHMWLKLFLSFREEEVLQEVRLLSTRRASGVQLERLYPLGIKWDLGHGCCT